MLGYVKCQSGDMLVKHHALYSAMYCGLCHSIKKNIGFAQLPFLSYDFVFLSFLRALASGEKIETEKQFCLLHPLGNKKKRVKDNDALLFSAKSSLVLTCEKMKDDLLDRDSSFVRRLLVLPFYGILQKKRKKLARKDEAFSQLSESLALLMEEGRRLEKESATLDDLCSFFASCLAKILSFGFEGEKETVLAGIGDRLGRLLYTLDAIDDLEKDAKTGAFNPILKEYKSVEKAKENFPSLDMVLSFYISEMALALDLIEGDENLFAICEHIVTKGIPGNVRKILKEKMENANERSL